jgi:hypothetical protein
VKNVRSNSVIVCLGIVVFALVLTGQSIAKVDLGKAVGIWTFDDGSGKVAKDSSGNGNDGNFVKEPKWVNGKFGKALDFNGVGDYVDCGNAKSFELTDAITIVAWMNPSDQAFAHQDFVGKPLSYILGHMDPPGPTLRCYINNGGWVGADFSKPFADFVGKWTHFAFTFDSSKIKIYVNGSLDKEVSTGGKMVVNQNHVVIANSAEAPGLSAFFKGIIDEVAIFNVALSESDIKDIMNNGIVGLQAVSSSGKLVTVWAMIKSQ